MAIWVYSWYSPGTGSIRYSCSVLNAHVAATRTTTVQFSLSLKHLRNVYRTRNNTWTGITANTVAINESDVAFVVRTEDGWGSVLLHMIIKAAYRPPLALSSGLDVCTAGDWPAAGRDRRRTRAKRRRRRRCKWWQQCGGGCNDGGGGAPRPSRGSVRGTETLTEWWTFAAKSVVNFE